MDADRQWHLDKKVPIAMMATVAIQTVVIIWWAAALTARVEHLERQAMLVQPQGDRLTRVEVRLEGVQNGIDEIKRLIRRTIDAPPP